MTVHFLLYDAVLIFKILLDSMMCILLNETACVRFGMGGR